MSLRKRTEVSMTPDQMLIAAAISSWQQVATRIGTLCSGLNQEQLLVEVAPGKNRTLYLWEHLTAVHDAMFSVLRTGERLHPELDAFFITQPDRSKPLPKAAEIARLVGGDSYGTPFDIRDSWSSRMVRKARQCFG
jgi:hypothetical protein